MTEAKGSDFDILSYIGLPAFGAPEKRVSAVTRQTWIGPRGDDSPKILKPKSSCSPASTRRSADQQTQFPTPRADEAVTEARPACHTVERTGGMKEVEVEDPQPVEETIDEARLRGTHEMAAYADELRRQMQDVEQRRRSESDDLRRGKCAVILKDSAIPPRRKVASRCTPTDQLSLSFASFSQPPCDPSSSFSTESATLGSTIVATTSSGSGACGLQVADLGTSTAAAAAPTSGCQRLLP